MSVKDLVKDARWIQDQGYLAVLVILGGAGGAYLGHVETIRDVPRHYKGMAIVKAEDALRFVLSKKKRGVREKIPKEAVLFKNPSGRDSDIVVGDWENWDANHPDLWKLYSVNNGRDLLIVGSGVDIGSQLESLGYMPDDPDLGGFETCTYEYIEDPRKIDKLLRGARDLS